MESHTSTNAADWNAMKSTFGERFKEHLKAPSSKYDDQSRTDHGTSGEHFNILGRDGHNLARATRSPSIPDPKVIPLTGTLVSITSLINGIEFH